jgi:CrcB protein
MSPLVWVAVVFIGGAGSTARYLVDGVVASRRGRAFPFGTLVINVSGAFSLGLLTGLVGSPTTPLLAGTAAVGSYTTFSTWMLETERLSEDTAYGLAAANVLVSLVVGVSAAALGRLLGTHL